MKDKIEVKFRGDICSLSISKLDEIVGHSNMMRLLLHLKGYPRFKPIIQEKGK